MQSARIASIAWVALAWVAWTSAHACTCVDASDELRVDDLDDNLDDNLDDDFVNDDDDDDQPPVGCDAACAEAANSEGAAAQCYACRCKEAFDDWLPSREELQCGAGVEVEVYRTVDAQTSAPLGADEYPSECNNPSLFQIDCGRRARYGSIERGDVTVRFLCRRFNVGAPPADTYDLVGVIGHNRRTGATCVWDAQVFLGDDDVPALDITGADERERAQFAETFARVYGDECVHCHDSDPFIYTPYLKSVGWQTNTYTTSPYGFVQLDGSVRATGRRHLVGPPVVQACTACHRIGDGETCALFARDALGVSAVAPHDFDPASAFAHAVWMPNDDVERASDREAWEAELGAARDKLLQCCDAAAAFAPDGDCEWQSIPSSN